MIDIKGVLVSMVYKFFDKKTFDSGIKNENISNQRTLDLATQELAEELHEPVNRKFNERKVNSSFIENIWGADFADMQLRSKCNKRTRFLLFVIDIFIKCAWVIPLKDKKGIAIINTFQKIFKRI